MGLQIILKGADFSASNLGNISDALASEKFIALAGITNEAHKTAIRNLNSSLISAGVFVKAKAIYPMIGGTALAHSINLRNPELTDAANRITFFSDSAAAHTAAGYVLNGARYGNTYYKPANVGNMFMGVLNSTAETAGDKMLTGVNSQAIPGNSTQGSLLWISRTYQGKTQGVYSTNQNMVLPSDGAYATNKTGLLLLNSKNSSDMDLFDNGALIGEYNADRSPIGAVGFPVYLGGFNQNSTGAAGLFSTATIGFAIYGDKALTNQEAIDLDTIVKAFQLAVR